MRNKDRPPSDEDQKERKFPGQGPVGFVEDLSEDFSLALAQLLILFEK
jgi:hypothetical protein